MKRDAQFISNCFLTKFAPIQSLAATGDQTESDGRSDDTVRSRNRQFEEGRDQQPQSTTAECRQQSKH